MNLEARTTELSKDNFNAAIEAFLRSMDVIKDSETPSKLEYHPHTTQEDLVLVTIHFQQKESRAVDHPVLKH